MTLVTVTTPARLTEPPHPNSGLVNLDASWLQPLNKQTPAVLHNESVDRHIESMHVSLFVICNIFLITVIGLCLVIVHYFDASHIGLYRPLNPVV
jgi:hypothetical protein